MRCFFAKLEEFIKKLSNKADIFYRTYGIKLRKRRRAMQINGVERNQIKVAINEMENPLMGAERGTITSEVIRNTSNNLKTAETTNEDKEQNLINAIEKASGRIENYNKKLEFSIHKETNQIMIKVVDKNTKKVIKEIPPEKILDMMAKMVELSGNFIDERR